jgi:hypothetical protein
LLDISRKLPYTDATGTDPGLESSSTRLSPQRCSSMPPGVARRLRAANALRSSETQGNSRTKETFARRLGERVGRKMQRLIDYIDLLASSSIEIRDCVSVCLALGPYRNLTTLTASTLFLHPNCQVLNHGGGRIFGRRNVDFLSDYTEEKFDRFIQYAIRLSTKGKRGRYGGSITLSHAFDSGHPMKEIFFSTGNRLLKKKIRCLFWKESFRTSRLIREKNVDLGSIFKRNDRLRFLLPIRNPLDCALSNMKTGHVNLFENLNGQSTEFEVLQAVLDEILWFAKLEEEYPGRFFHYFEHSISREMLGRLASFLELDPLESWFDSALLAMKPKGGYQHDDDLVAFYRQYVNDEFVCFPDLSAGLLLFIAKEKKEPS